MRSRARGSSTRSPNIGPWCARSPWAKRQIADSAIRNSCRRHDSPALSIRWRGLRPPISCRCWSHPTSRRDTSWSTRGPTISGFRAVRRRAIRRPAAHCRRTASCWCACTPACTGEAAPSERSASLHEFLARDRLEILVVDLLFHVLREIERLQNPQRFADVAGAFLGIERTVGGEHDLLGWIKGEAADGRGVGAEHGGVGVEILLEVVERALLEALAQRHVVLVRGAGAELIPARADAAFEDRDDAAEMVDDELQVGMAVDHLGEHEAPHGGRGLVGPAEGPPDFVERFLLVHVVGPRSGARRMDPDWLADLFHRRPELLVLRPVDRRAVDVRINLHA